MNYTKEQREADEKWARDIRESSAHHIPAGRCQCSNCSLLRLLDDARAERARDIARATEYLDGELAKARAELAEAQETLRATLVKLDVADSAERAAVKLFDDARQEAECLRRDLAKAKRERDAWRDKAETRGRVAAAARAELAEAKRGVEEWRTLTERCEDVADLRAERDRLRELLDEALGEAVFSDEFAARIRAAIAPAPAPPTPTEAEISDAVMLGNDIAPPSHPASGPLLRAEPVATTRAPAEAEVRCCCGGFTLATKATIIAIGIGGHSYLSCSFADGKEIARNRVDASATAQREFAAPTRMRPGCPCDVCKKRWPEAQRRPAMTPEERTEYIKQRWGKALDLMAEGPGAPASEAERLDVASELVARETRGECWACETKHGGQHAAECPERPSQPRMSDADVARALREVAECVARSFNCVDDAHTFAHSLEADLIWRAGELEKS